MNCYECDIEDNEIIIDWLQEAEEQIETFYCNRCHKFLGVGMIK